jgi:hypothetical protein
MQVCGFSSAFEVFQILDFGKKNLKSKKCHEEILLLNADKNKFI